MEKLWKATPLFIACSLYASCAVADMPQPPATEKIPHQLIEHGDIRVDNYFWLRDDSRSDAKSTASPGR
ncbi:Protease 2 [Cedecea neteri]|uniref:Protease 2 n=1 Tax=Cedecea neteri TaxID=158822 RepID=A0A2X3J1Q7_9ENTR|nr:Protease 2 [Cedecea neteri]